MGAGGLGSPGAACTLPRRGGHARHRRFRRRRRVEPAAADHPRPVRRRPPKAESRRATRPGDQPLVNVVVHNDALTTDNVMEIFAGYDLIVDGTDNFATRYMVNDAAVLLGKPYVWGSIYRFDGQASVFWAEHGPCYRCLYPEPPPPGMVPSCAEGGVLGVLCASIGSIQVNEAIKLLTGIGEPLVGRLMIYDALEMNYREVKVRKDPELRALRQEPDHHRADRLRGVLRHDLRRGRSRPRRAPRSPRASSRTCRTAGTTSSSIDVREPNEYEIVSHPRRRADPQGRVPQGRRAGAAAAGQADRAALQVRRPVAPRCCAVEERRLLRRRPRRRRRADAGSRPSTPRFQRTDRSR